MKSIRLGLALMVAFVVAGLAVLLNAKPWDKPGVPTAPEGSPAFAPQGGRKWIGGGSGTDTALGGGGYWKDERTGWKYERPPTQDQLASGKWRYYPGR